MDAYRRALDTFRPTPPLTTKDIPALVQLVTGDVNLIVTQLVEDAVLARQAAQLRVRKSLTDWARMQRRVPAEEREQDRQDAAALDKALEDKRPEGADPNRYEAEDYIEGIDLRTGQPRRFRTLRVPLGPAEA